MKAFSVRSAARARADVAPGLLDRVLRDAVLRQLRGLRDGALTVAHDGVRETFGARSEAVPLSASVTVRDPAFWAALALRGSVGAGESYMRGEWETDDLTAVIRIILRNQALMQGMDSGLARLAEPLLRLAHRARRNTRDGAKANVAAHYDLGNDFFALLLDPSLTYSCGIWEREDSTLAEAQAAKIDRACRKLALSSSDHLFEIGTGWGALALHAARHFGCRVTSVTLSREQHAVASERVRAAGLADRVSILLQDYRDVPQRFDKLVSIEMIEQVGDDHLDEFFATCSRLLEPHGLMLLQSITIRDSEHARHRKSVDFIKAHVFPGTCIPSVAAIADRLARVTDLKLSHLEDIGPHYARTLAAWHGNLVTHAEAIRALGYSEEMLRGFEFYLCYCEAGFEERYLGDVQALLAKPLDRRAPIVPALA